jgi:hypothetical protein
MRIKQLVNTFIRDKNGVIVLWQFPNVPLIGWFVCLVVGYLIPSGPLKNGFEHLSGAFLFVWAYLEITQGTTYLRRSLGVAVLLIILAGFFR